jgi:hypothetical protein
MSKKHPPKESGTKAIRHWAVEDRLGIWKQLEDVPPRRRFENLSGSFYHDDPWRAFLEEKDLAESTAKKYQRAYNCWREHMDGYDRHHLLPDPDHVESYFDWLRHRSTPYQRNGKPTKIVTLYKGYFISINGLFRWLMTHAEYQHLYSPVYMAAARDGIVREIWEGKYYER